MKNQFQHLISNFISLCVLSLATALPSYAANPVGDVFSNMPGSNWAAVESAATAQTTSTPYYKSNAEETLTYQGYFKANDSNTKLAIFSDDGCDVSIDGKKVHSRFNQGQALPDLEQSLHAIEANFEAERVYYIKVEFSNTHLTGDTDVDGLTLFCYGGGGEIVAPPIDLSVQNVDDDEEEDFGGWLPNNDDDDNQNDQPDSAENGSVGSENDLVWMSLDVPSEQEGATATLSATAGSSYIRTWSDATKSEEVTLPKIYEIGVDDVPEKIWVEGVNTSGERAVQVKLEYSGDGGDSTDIVNLSVFNADLWNPNNHDTFHTGDHECDVFFKALVKPFTPNSQTTKHKVVIERSPSEDGPWSAWIELKPLKADSNYGEDAHIFTAVKQTEGHNSKNWYIRTSHELRKKSDNSLVGIYNSDSKFIHFLKLGWPISSQNYVTDTYHPSSSWRGKNYRRGHHGIDLDTPNNSVSAVYASERGYSITYGSSSSDGGNSIRVFHRPDDEVCGDDYPKIKVDLDYQKTQGSEGDEVPSEASYTEMYVWTTYHHLQYAGRESGIVGRNSKIANENNTGNSGGDHLHFGVLVNGTSNWPSSEWDANYTRNPNPGTDRGYFYDGSSADTTSQGAPIHPDWDDDDPNQAGPENDEDE